MNAPTIPETQEERARRLFDEMAYAIGRDAVAHLTGMYPQVLSEQAASRAWQASLANHIRSGIQWRMRPLMLAMIAMHQEWKECQ